jgi:hypothetical protein
MIVISSVQWRGAQIVSIRSFSWFGGSKTKICQYQNWKNVILQHLVLDLWMSNEAHDVFALVMNFLGMDW